MQKSLKDFKEKIYRHCQQKLEEQLHALQLVIQSTREALESEGKSTAGDKHETGRAMIQLEQEKLGYQFQELKKTKLLFDGVPYASSFSTIEVGALVKTNTGLFFISVGMGEEVLDGETIFVIAPMAPFAQSILGKKTGDSITFNKRTIEIEQVA